MLQRLADRTQGLFLGTLHTDDDVTALTASWEAFASATPARVVVHTSSERLPLHAQLWLLISLLTLLTAEWAIRRAGGGR